MVDFNSPKMNRAGLISIIVPVLNEDTTLKSTLELAFTQQRPHEIIVVDGGSDDSTLKIAKQFDCKIIKSESGRGVQMNTGAEIAKGDIFLFLHADSHLPKKALLKMRQAVLDGFDYGSFTMRYDTLRPDYLYGAWVADSYCRVMNETFGDRAIFVTKAAFEKVGGYSEIKIMEDIDLSVRLKQSGFKMKLINGFVITSRRRFSNTSIWRAGWTSWKLLLDWHMERSLDQASLDYYLKEKR
ncbi:MAG: TIGR04283 family arsenosugar biosynthesis glycosyltransferase [bacterium]